MARMAGMPVATLRIWEQRYQAVRPTTAASGHRLYCAADVERVTLLRRLTEQGHAIGLLASVSTAQLRQMLQVQPGARSLPREIPAHPQAVLKVIVIGQALASRLRRLASRPVSALLLEPMGVFVSPAEAGRAAPSATSPGIDLLLWQTGSLRPETLHELRAAQQAWGAAAAAVVYRHGSSADRRALVGAGAAVIQEPADDDALAQWLALLAPTAIGRHGAQPHPGPGPIDPQHLLNQAVTAPRFAEAALTEFAALPSSMACECPRHVAELLLQISSFETYSSECAHRNAADAQLHGDLQRVAATARMLFESALERVAIAEGLPMPASR